MGAEIKKWYIDDSDDPGKVRWAMSSNKFVNKVLEDIERELATAGRNLQTETTLHWRSWQKADAKIHSVEERNCSQVKTITDLVSIEGLNQKCSSMVRISSCIGNIGKRKQDR